LLQLFHIKLAIIVLLASFQYQQKEDNEDMETNGSCSVKGGELSVGGTSCFLAIFCKSSTLPSNAPPLAFCSKVFLPIVSSESQWGKGVNATKQKNPLSVMGAGTIHDSAYPTIPITDRGFFCLVAFTPFPH
jgi:hypothetical protein